MQKWGQLGTKNFKNTGPLETRIKKTTGQPGSASSDTELLCTESEFPTAFYAAYGPELPSFLQTVSKSADVKLNLAESSTPNGKPNGQDGARMTIQQNGKATSRLPRSGQRNKTSGYSKALTPLTQASIGDIVWASRQSRCGMCCHELFPKAKAGFKGNGFHLNLMMQHHPQEEWM